jgi:hypothetical protein
VPADLFRAEPPFAIEGVTREFRIEPPTADALGSTLGPPTPPVTHPLRSFPGSLAQFPIGLAYYPLRDALLLSTGFNDVETLLTRIDVPHLLLRLQQVRGHEASGGSDLERPLPLYM